MHPGVVEEFFIFYDRLATVLEGFDGEKMTKGRIEEARRMLHRMDRMLHMLAMESGMPQGFIEHMMDRRSRRMKPEES